jgi:hypothetical protein
MRPVVLDEVAAAGAWPQTGEMPHDDYSSVPAADPDAEVDPHFLELRGQSSLPPTYMPPSMPGRHSRGTRVTAVVIIGVFLAATASGVCLTYGPSLLGR